MKNFENVACEICGSYDFDLVYNGKVKDKEKVHVCLCKKCGFCYLNPRWTEDSYLYYYTYEYNKNYRNTVSLLSPEQDSASYHPIYLRLQNLDNFNPQNILDIGTGDGEKLSYLTNKYTNAKAYALEPSEEYTTQIKERGIHFIGTDVNSNWEEPYKNTFDVVILRHTIEHFLNPKLVLDKINQVLSKDGLLYIATPDAMLVDPPLINNFFRVVHPYYFNQVSLRNLMLLNGFTILSLGNDTYHPYEMFVLARKGQKIAEIKFDSNNYIQQKELFLKYIKKETSIIYRIFLLKNYIVKIKKKFFPKPFKK